MKNILILLCLLFLSACAVQQQPKAKPLPLVEQTRTVNLPPDLLKDCTSLTPLTPNTSYDQGASVGVVKKWAAENQDCAQRFTAVRNLTAQAFNIKIDVHGNVITPTVPASGTTTTK